MKKYKIFSHNSENLPREATSRVSKKISRRPIKNLLLTKVAHCSGDEKNIYNMVIGPILASGNAKN